MKNLLSLIAICFCLSLTGCVSDSEFKALEDRVSSLEEQLEKSTAVSVTETGATAISNAGSQSNKVELYDTEAISESTSDIGENTHGSYTYCIDKLSNDSVVAECEYYFNNAPAQGDSFDTYYSKLKATPVKRFDDNGVNCLFYDIVQDEHPSNHDYITAISIPGSQTEMDGSIGYQGNQYSVHVSMIIQDYERAAFIYDKLYDIIVNEHYTDINDKRDSTNWRSTAMFWDTDSGAFGVTFLSMTKQDFGYELEATKSFRR